MARLEITSLNSQFWLKEAYYQMLGWGKRRDCGLKDVMVYELAIKASCRHVQVAL